MTVCIEPLGAAILLVGVLVGCIAYRYTRASSAPASRGDIVGVIASAAAVITALVLSLGGGNKATAESENPAPVSSPSAVRQAHSPPASAPAQAPLGSDERRNTLSPGMRRIRRRRRQAAPWSKSDRSSSSSLARG